MKESEIDFSINCWVLICSSIKVCKHVYDPTAVCGTFITFACLNASPSEYYSYHAVLRASFNFDVSVSEYRLRLSTFVSLQFDLNWELVFHVYFLLVLYNINWTTAVAVTFEIVFFFCSWHHVTVYRCNIVFQPLFSWHKIITWDLRQPWRK